MRANTKVALKGSPTSLGMYHLLMKSGLAIFSDEFQLQVKNDFLNEITPSTIYGCYGFWCPWCADMKGGVVCQQTLMLLTAMHWVMLLELSFKAEKRV